MLHTVVIDLLYAAGLVRGVGGFLSRWLDSLSVYHALPHRSVYHSPTPAVEFFLPANSRFIRSVRSHQKTAAFCSNHVGQSEVFCGQFCSAVRRNTGLPNRFTLFMAIKKHLDDFRHTHGMVMEVFFYDPHNARTEPRGSNGHLCKAEVPTDRKSLCGTDRQDRPSYTGWM